MEGTETFTLGLTAKDRMPIGSNVFFIDRANFTIIDTDGEAIQIYVLIMLQVYAMQRFHSIFARHFNVYLVESCINYVPLHSLCDHN